MNRRETPTHPARCTLLGLSFSALMLLTVGVPARGQSSPERFLDVEQATAERDERIERTSYNAAGLSYERAATDDICWSSCATDDGWFGGASFLFIRPHFSEAIAFSRGMQTPTTYDIEDSDLQFDYEGSVRATAGYRCGDGEARFTYSRLTGSTGVAGAASGPGEFIVDPFGNIVGSVTIIDPSDPRFGTVVVGGDAIDTRADVDLDVFDIELSRSIGGSTATWDVAWSIGARVANIDQFYESIITSTGGPVLARGHFEVNFIGAGPRVGLAGRRYFGCQQRWSLFADTHASLLVGEYDGRFGNATTTPTFAMSQRETVTRMIPVFEIELGASRRLGERLEVSAGWMFQSWFDLGTSGGEFAGLFLGADDANIMSFDGLVISAEASF